MFHLAKVGLVIALLALVAVVVGVGTPQVARVQLAAAIPSCQLLPIATSSATIANAVVGKEVGDILNSDLPGQQGWVTWTGNVSESALAASLALPGNSATYVDPDDPADRAVSERDWVQAKPDVVSGRGVRTALDRLVGEEIVVLVWDATRGVGVNAAYRVAGFARFSVTRHRLAENRISARYRGPAECLPPPGGPTADETSATTAEDEPTSIVLTGRSPHPATLSFVLAQPQNGTAVIDGPASCASVPPGGGGGGGDDDDDDDGGGDDDDDDGGGDDDDDGGGGGGGGTTGGPATCSVTALYTPNPDFNGVDRFSFTVSDGLTTSSAGTVTVEVSPVNDAPVAGADAAAAQQDTALELPVAGLLANDVPGPANEAGQTLTVTAVTTSAASHGSATLVGGTITYTPDAGFTGTAVITYTVCDDGTTAGQPDPRCNDGTITITVDAGANEPPTADPQTVSAVEDTPLPVTLTGSDPDGDPPTFAVAAGPAHGTLSGTAPNLTYTPAADYYGPDSFTFTASDGQDQSAPATVAITVTEVNDAPVAGADAAAAQQDTALELPVAGLLANDVPGPANEAGQTLTVTAVTTSAASHGSATLVGGTITYTPDAGYTGPATIAYTVCDDGTTAGQPDPRCNDGTITITVTAGPNEPPTADPQQVTAAEDTSLAVVLSGNDPDGDALTFAVTAGPAHGTLNPEGSPSKVSPGSSLHDVLPLSPWGGLGSGLGP